MPRTPKNVHFGTALRCTSLLLFALLLPAAAAAQPGTITGTVTDVGTGLPIANISVTAFDFKLNPVGNVTTNAAGVYTMPNVPPGTYAVAAGVDSEGGPSSTAGYVPQVYPNIVCPGSCAEFYPFVGDFVAVTAGGTTSGINLAMTMGGRISGTVKNAAGNPIANVTVTALFSSPDFIYEEGQIGSEGNFANSATTNASGMFTIANLPTGTYYLRTEISGNADLIPEVFDNLPCVVDCDERTAVERGRPIAVTAGATISGKDFSLEIGGTISGTVTNAATGAPLPNVGISVYAKVDGRPSFVTFQSANASGVYTVRGLPTGTYYLHTNAFQNVVNKIYGDIRCPGNCNGDVAVESGTAVSVTAAAATTGKDFALEPGGAVSGTVTKEFDGAPMSNIEVKVVARLGSRFVTRSAMTNASGNYTVNGLPTGTYWAFTNTPNGLINEILDNIQCRGTCTEAAAVATGAPIQVTAGSTTSGKNFALELGGTVSGKVTDAANGTALGGIGVELWYQNGSTLARILTTETNGSGQYTFGGLMSGNYYVATHSFQGFVDKAYDNITCVAGQDEGDGCAEATIASSTPVAVTARMATPNINFALSFGAAIKGVVTDAATGLPIDFILIGLLDATTGDVVSLGFTVPGAAGRYIMGGVPPGNYVAFTYSVTGYVHEIYNNIACAGLCSFAIATSQGTRITVSAGGLVTGINFALDRRVDGPPAAPRRLTASVTGFTAQFNWTAPSILTNVGATSYVLEAGLTPGATFTSIPVGTTSFQAPGVPPGVYYVRVRGLTAAGLGPASNEVRLEVGSTGVSRPAAPTNIAAVVNDHRLTLTWAEDESGAAATGYIVEAGTATGSSNIASLPVQARTFTFNPVPDGFYFLRVRAVNSAGSSSPSTEAMIVVGGVPAPPAAPDFTSFTGTGSSVTLTWAASTGATSYILEAGSGPGLSNLVTFNTGNSLTTATFNNVPPGTYYVRIRAVNAQGTSVVSNERSITLP